MKRLLVVLMILGIVGCSSKEELQSTETPTITSTPESTEVVVEPTATPHPDSKINIDLYKVDEYYPVVDGVVTYPDGTTEEFNNGTWVDDLGGGSIEKILCVYQVNFPTRWIEEELVRQEEAKQGGGHRFFKDNEFVVLPGNFYVYLLKGEYRPESLEFRYSVLNEEGIIDGVFGYDFISNEGYQYTEVVFRYSNHIPEGYEINEASNVNVDEDSFYMWNITEYDEEVSLIDKEDLFSKRGYLSWPPARQGCGINPMEWWER